MFYQFDYSINSAGTQAAGKDFASSVRWAEEAGKFCQDMLTIFNICGTM
jgi:hypothetical protein